MACVVVGCKSHSSRQENETKPLTFHRLPKNEVTKIKWRQCINRPDWTPNQRICSKHFTNDSFVNNDKKWRRLKSDAIPTLNIPKNTCYSIVEPLKENNSKLTPINLKRKITSIDCSKANKDSMLVQFGSISFQTKNNLALQLAEHNVLPSLAF